jgi:hypothetical protein
MVLSQVPKSEAPGSPAAPEGGWLAENGESGFVISPRPAHRDKTAMNGAQLLLNQDDFDDRATCLQVY